jgi:hypothetical protein
LEAVTILGRATIRTQPHPCFDRNVTPSPLSVSGMTLWPALYAASDNDEANHHKERKKNSSNVPIPNMGQFVR